MKDLDFIRTVVKEWPEGAEFVRLDADGEICFTVGASEFQNGDFDFYPSKSLRAEDAFIAGSKYRTIGTRYTREQWEKPATDPVIEALKVGLTPDQLQALMTSQDGLQLRADAGRAGFIAGCEYAGDGFCSIPDAQAADRHEGRVKAGNL